jgi:nitrite reductase (NO-forming)
MTSTVASSPALATAAGAAFTPSVRRLHAAAVVRILFGCVWAIDAVFKFLPGFVHGQTLGDELGKGAQVHTPVIHQWIQLWHAIGTAHPQAFAIGTGVVESCIALGLILAPSPTWCCSAALSSASGSGRRPRASTCRGPSPG